MSEEPKTALPDARDRQIAATDFATNLVVVAGAGTGKTSLLIERMLNALGSGRVEIDTLGAMTFTEKAAGEMRQRLATQLERLLALALGRGDAKSDEADRSWAYLSIKAGIDPSTIAARAATALEALDRATVTTIHGLCADLLRGHAVAAGVDPDFTVDTGEKAEILLRELWREFLSRELGPQAPRRALWRRVLGSFSLDQTEQAAVSMAGFALPMDLLVPPFERPEPRELFGEELARLHAALDTLLTQQQGLTPMAHGYFSAVFGHLGVLRDRGHAEFVSALGNDPDLLERIVGKKKPPDSFKQLSGFDPREAKQLGRDTRSFLNRMRKIEDATVESLVELLGPFVMEFREAMLRQSLVSFDGLLVLARDLLLGSVEIRRRLKRRFRILLVDEFQDTDPVQYEIVFLLAESEDGCATDAYEASLEPGKLFIVGDEKQSIYRFRGADFEAYRRAVEHVLAQDGRRVELSANFRSVPGVIEPVNRLFQSHAVSRWIPSAYQPPYREIQAVKADRGAGAATEIWRLDIDPGTSAAQRREAEGELIAEQIDNLVQAGAVRFRDISLLFRAFSSLAPYLRPLRHRRIPFVVDGGRDFLERPEITQTFATIRSLAQPANEAALVSFLRSPAGGVSDRELTLYARAGGRWSYREQPSPEDFPVIARRFQLLRDLEDETRTLPVDAVVRHIVKRAHVIPLNAVAFEGAQRVANLRKLADAAGALGRDGRLTLLDVVETLESSTLGDLAAEAPLADDAVDAVRVSSIHRMKGLENRWIILPDLSRARPSGSGEPVLTGLVRVGGARTVAVRIGDTANAAAIWRQAEDQLHEEAEETRLLYVALTRACERLVVLATPTKQAAPWLKALEPWGFDAYATATDGETFVNGQVVLRVMQPQVSRGDAEPQPHRSSEPAVERYRAAIRRMSEAGGPIAPSTTGATAESTAWRLDRPSPVADLGRVSGIVIHRLLERRRGEDLTETRALARRLVQSTVADDSPELEAIRRDVVSVVDRFFESGLAARFDGLDVIGREVPMLLRADGDRVIRGTIDLLYRDLDGRVVVVDFKTDRETPAAALVDRYGAQLASYTRAVRLARPQSDRPLAELWALRAGVVIRLPDPDAG